MTLREAICGAADAFSRAGCETPVLDAEVLMAFVLGLSRAGVLARRPESLPVAEEQRYAALCGRRLRREPVSQLIGKREFYSRDFEVTRDVLTPRPETELLVEQGLMCVDHGARRVVDVGVGSGAIAITLACERLSMPDLSIFGVDLSYGALQVARGNAQRLLPSGRHIPWIQTDLLEGFRPGSLDLIVSNPPYITPDALVDAAPELAFEPKIALAGGDFDGLGVIRKLVGAAWEKLCPGGAFLFEIGSDQGASSVEIVEGTGFVGVEVLPDLEGRDRVLRAEKIAD